MSVETGELAKEALLNQRPSGNNFRVRSVKLLMTTGVSLAVDRARHYCSCYFLPCRSSRTVMSRSCHLSSSLALSRTFSLVWFVWFPCVWLRLSCHHKGSGSYVHFCPPPCSSTYRWATLSNHQHKGTTLKEVRALTPPLAVKPPHVCHRRETGHSPLARTRSKTWSFMSAPPHLSAVPPLVRTGHQRSLVQ